MAAALALALALLATPLLAVLFGRLAEGRLPVPPAAPAALVRSPDGVAALVSLALSALAVALLPWPLHPAAGAPLVGHPIAVWGALEAAFLAPLLPALLAPSPLAARAASREAQISAAGRAVAWLAAGAALWLGAGWTPAEIAGRALAALGALAALPAAAGLGPFAPETSLAPEGAEEGLDEDTAGLLRFARTVRAAALLAAVVVASAPLASVAAPAALILALAVFTAAAAALGRFGAGQPRLTLPAALRWCWWRALPLAAAGLLALILL